MIEWGPIILSLKLAGITTLLLLVIAIPLSYWLSYTKSLAKPVIETLVSMPGITPNGIGILFTDCFQPCKCVWGIS